MSLDEVKVNLYNIRFIKLIFRVFYDFSLKSSIITWGKIINIIYKLIYT